MKRLLTLAFVASVAVLSAQTPSALADAQKALGGELPASFKNFVAKGVRRNIVAGKPATEIPFEWAFELPNKFVWIEKNPNNFVIGFNGNKVVSNQPEDLMGTSIFGEDRTGVMRDEEQLVSAHINFAIVSLGFFAREFRQSYPMQFFKNQGDPNSVNIEADQLSATFTVDPVTHLPKQLGWRQQGRMGVGGALVTRLFAYSNYRDVAERKIPGRISFYLGEAKTDKLLEMTRWELQSFEINANIDPKIFKPTK